MKNISQTIYFTFVLFLLFAYVVLPAHSETHTVTVNADGTFSPMWIWIRDGDTVEWQFHERRDTIIPVTWDGASSSGCSTLLFTSNLQPSPNFTLQQLLEELWEEFDQNGIPLSDNVTVSVQVPNSEWLITDEEANNRTYTLRREADGLSVYGLAYYKLYDPADPNEFTGPMPRAASGIFTLGPDGKGFVPEKLGDPDASCKDNQIRLRVGNEYLCESGKDFASMTWTFQQPNITGVFIRVRWNEVHLGPGVFDWSDMDREIEKAVRNGKLYSLSFKAGSKGTPDWIFNPAIAGETAVKPLRFQDAGDNAEGCGVRMTLGSPADQNYRTHYFALWEAAAHHIREKNAWYRALAYVKPSGANLFSHENRLPNVCESECETCNPQVWAEEGGYTPTALYEFYSEQTAVLAAEFPDKDMSYMLIQAGFPQVNDNGEYKKPLTAPLPGGVEQTVSILAQGRFEHGTRFAVQHNGLGTRPQDRPGQKPACPNEGVHPAVPPFEFAGSGCPNRYVLLEGADGQVTGFQTNNSKGVADPIELESALRNAWDNSDAIFLEIYEQRFWEAELAGPVLDPNASGRTIGNWAEMFHERRRGDWPEIPDPFPMTHSHTFTRTIDSSSDTQLLYYIHGSKCEVGDVEKYGVIAILPDDPTLTVGDYQLVSRERVNRTEFDFSFTAQIANVGPATPNVLATVTSISQHTTVVDGTLSFGDVPAGSQVLSSNTFTIRHDRRFPFDLSSLVWEATFSTANPTQ